MSRDSAAQGRAAFVVCARVIALALIAALAATTRAVAHDFWLQPSAFRMAGPVTSGVTLQVGDGAMRQRSQIPTRRITRFTLMAPDAGVHDLREQLLVRAPGHDAEVSYVAPGTYVLALETDNRARSYLSASAFNEYLRTEGLTPALEARSRTGSMEAGAAEKYSRCAKAIVRVGSPSASDVSALNVSAPLGLKLEIVPEVNPYAEPRPASLPVRVLYEGRALPGALVKVIDLNRNIEPIETRVTDAGGRAILPAPAAGAWLLSVVWTTPLEAAEDADFETTFSTLSFGFDALAAVSSPEELQSRR
jgi:uncharacterized GH25 family protein